MGEIVGGTIVFGEENAEPLLGLTALECRSASKSIRLTSGLNDCPPYVSDRCRDNPLWLSFCMG